MIFVQFLYGFIYMKDFRTLLVIYSDINDKRYVNLLELQEIQRKQIYDRSIKIITKYNPNVKKGFKVKLYDYNGYKYYESTHFEDFDKIFKEVERMPSFAMEVRNFNTGKNYRMMRYPAFYETIGTTILF
jgi:hypothetical protein